MASAKTLTLLLVFLCVISTASASVMLEKWMVLLDDLNFTNFKALIVWLMWGMLGPFLAGVARSTSNDYWDSFSDDVKYVACSAGVCTFDDIFAYVMNYVLYKYLYKYLGISYTDDDFVELDFEDMANLS